MAASTPKKKFKRHAPTKRVSETSHDNITLPTPPENQPAEPPPIPSVKVAMEFHHITRDYDVRFFTGLTSSVTFKSLYDLIFRKANAMSYWQGLKRTGKRSHSEILSEYGLELEKTGPSRKLSLEQELLMTLMKLRLGLLTDDLAFRFDVDVFHKYLQHGSNFFQKSCLA